MPKFEEEVVSQPLAFEEEVVSKPQAKKVSQPSFQEEVVSAPRPAFEEELVNDVFAPSELEGIRKTEAAQKQQAAAMRAQAEQLRQQEAQNPDNWTSKQVQDHFKKNPPKNVKEQAEANAAIELKKHQEQKLTDQLLPPDLRKEKPIQLNGAPERREEQTPLEIAFSQSDTTGKGLSDLLQFAMQRLPGMRGELPEEMKKNLDAFMKASPGGQLLESLSREESSVAAPILELMKSKDPVKALKAIAEAAGGSNRGQLGDVFREMGADEKTSAMLGFISSLLLPSNLMAGKAGLKALPQAGEKTVQETALEIPTKFKSQNPIGMSKTAQEGVLDVFPAAQKEVQFRPPLPDKEGFSSNINLEKITSDEDLQGIIKSTSEKFKGTIDEQRRGIITHEETQILADNLGVSPDDLKRVRAGRAFNAEELKATSDLLLTQSKKVADLAGKIRTGDNSTQTLLQFQKELQAQALVQIKLSGAKAESGRALQIQRVIAREVPSELKAQQEVLKALGGQEITEEIAHRLSLIDPMDIPAVNKFIREVTKAKTADKVYEYWLNSILSNPQTHAVNTISNTLRAALEIPVDIAQAGIELFKGSGRQVFFGEAPSRLIGDLMGIKEGVRRALYVLKEGISIERNTQIESKVPAIKGKLGEIIRTPTKALTAEDEFFKAINATGDMYAGAYRTAAKEGHKGKALIRRMGELIENPTNEMLESMSKKALETTFQQDLGNWGNQILGFRSRLPGLRYLIPFVRTPGNILKEGFRFSPAGFVELGFKGVTQKTFDSRLASKAAVGSIIAANFALQAIEGNVTGDAPKDDAQRDAFYRSGKKPYSVKLGDQWIPFRRLEPINTSLSLIADGFERFKEGGDWGDLAMEAVFTIAQNFTNRSYLSGLNDFMNALNDPMRYARNYITRQAKGAVPFSGATRFAEQTIDPTLREPMKGDTGNDALDQVTQIGESISSDVPGLSKNVRPRLNVFGEEIKQEGGGFSALTPSKAKNDPVDQELERLGMAVTFTDPEKGEVRGVALSNDERFELQERAGKRIKNRLDKILTNPAYKRQDDEDKQRTIKKEVDKIQEEERLIEMGKALPRILKSDRAKEFAVTQFPKLQKSLKGKDLNTVLRDKESRQAWTEFQRLRTENEGLIKLPQKIIKV